jgi:hypothetical protein
MLLRWLRGIIVALLTVVIAILVLSPLFVRSKITQMNQMELVIAVGSYCRWFGHMPTSLGELVDLGYLRPAAESGERGFHRCGRRNSYAPPAGTQDVEVMPVFIPEPLGLSFAWGIHPDEVTIQNERLYRVGTQNEALLVINEGWGTRQWSRDRSLWLYESMRREKPAPASQNDN